MSDYWLAYQQPWVIVAIIAITAILANAIPAIVDTIIPPIMMIAFLPMDTVHHITTMVPVLPGTTSLRSLFQL